MHKFLSMGKSKFASAHSELRDEERLAEDDRESLKIPDFPVFLLDLNHKDRH